MAITFHAKVVPLLLSSVSLALFTFFLITLNAPPSHGVTELCNPNKSKVVYQFTVEQCPFGVLFAIPVRADCLKSATDNDQANFYSDLCENRKYDPDSSNEIQFITSLTDGALSEEDSCRGPGPNQCNVTDIKIVNMTEITEPGDDASFADEENFDEPDDVAQKRNDTQIFEQTIRMFQFIVGLEGEGENYVDDELERKKRSIGATSSDATNPNKTKNYDHEPPNIRVTEILKLSFKILNKHCDNNYVSNKFNRDVQRMFLFLLRETSTGQIEDVSEEEFHRIKKALDDCLEKDPVFILNGTSCRTSSRVKFIEKLGQTTAYRPDEFSYNPYIYDVPIDATWGTSDFVHGLCYGTFREHINSHHLYQRAVERLFNDAIQYRWSRPPKLLHEELWNNMLSANVRPTMRNLDVCIHAAYYDTPFIHRLERPLLHFTSPVKPDPKITDPTKPTDPTVRKRRRKRSTLSLDEVGLSEAGWCFQKEIEQKKIVQAYIEANCPTSEALSQFDDTFKTTTESSDDGGDEETTEETTTEESSPDP